MHSQLLMWPIQCTNIDSLLDWRVWLSRAIRMKEEKAKLKSEISNDSKIIIYGFTLTHPPFSLIHATNSSSITSAMPSINLGKYSGWFCRTQSTDNPAATANNAITCKQISIYMAFAVPLLSRLTFTLDHVMSVRKRSRETVANVTTTDSTDSNSPPLERHNCRATPENTFGCIRSNSSPTCKWHWH